MKENETKVTDIKTWTKHETSTTIANGEKRGGRERESEKKKKNLEPIFRIELFIIQLFVQFDWLNSIWICIEEFETIGNQIQNIGLKGKEIETHTHKVNDANKQKGKYSWQANMVLSLFLLNYTTKDREKDKRQKLLTKKSAI